MVCPLEGRLVKGRLNAGLTIIEGKRRKAETSALARRSLLTSETARLEDGVSTVVSWVTAAHKAMRGKRIELSDERSQRNRDSFAGTRAQVSWEQVTGRAD
jgi:hypothetical protein